MQLLPSSSLPPIIIDYHPGHHQHRQQQEPPRRNRKHQRIVRQQYFQFHIVHTRSFLLLFLISIIIATANASLSVRNHFITTTSTLHRCMIPARLTSSSLLLLLHCHYHPLSFFVKTSIYKRIHISSPCCFIPTTNMPVQTRSSSSSSSSYVQQQKATTTRTTTSSVFKKNNKNVLFTTFNNVNVRIRLKGIGISNEEEEEDNDSINILNVKEEEENEEEEEAKGTSVPDFSSFVYKEEPNSSGINGTRQQRAFTSSSSSSSKSATLTTTGGDNNNNNDDDGKEEEKENIIPTRSNARIRNATRPRAVRPKKRALSPTTTTSSSTINTNSPSSSSSSSSSTTTKQTNPKSSPSTKNPPSTPPPSTPTTTTTKNTTTSSKRKKRPKILPNTQPPPNPNWLTTYNLVKELRSDKTAPVDTDGSHALPEKHLGIQVYRYQVLIALMLSSQTKDAVVGETMRNLQLHGLTPQNIQKTSPQKLNQLLQKVGFHNNKTKYIHQTTSILLSPPYNGNIPTTATEMMKLPGVGPKMAYIIESVAFGTTSGIGVDTHMHRIFKQIKWVSSSNCNTPEQTREQLEGWLPKKYWSEVNVLWVGFGQEVQQQKEKALKKALSCSRPVEALSLYRKVGMDVKKEAKRFGLEEEVEFVLNGGRKK